MNNHNYDNNGAPYFSTNLNLHQQQSAPPPAPFFPPQQQHFNSNNSFQNPGMGGGNGFWDGNQGNNWNGGNVGRNFDGSGGAGMSGSGGGMVGGGRGNGFNEYGFSVDRFDRNFNGNGNGGNGYNDSGFGDGSGVDVKPKPQRNDEARLNDSAPSLSSPSPMVKHPTGRSARVDCSRMPALHLKLNYETATFLDFQPYFPNKSEVAVMAAWEKTYPPNKLNEISKQLDADRHSGQVLTPASKRKIDFYKIKNAMEKYVAHWESVKSCRYTEVPTPSTSNDVDVSRTKRALDDPETEEVSKRQKHTLHVFCCKPSGY